MTKHKLNRTITLNLILITKEMKKITTIAALAFASLLTLASCSKEENGKDLNNGDKTAVTLKVSYDKPLGSRAVGEAVLDGDEISLGLGHIFFTNASGLIYNHIEIINGTAGENQVALSAISSASGATLTGINASATKCYILSKANVTIPFIGAATNISEIEDLAMSVSDLADAKGAVTNVPVWGEGSLNKVSDPATVTVSMKPLASRLQIKKITAENYTYTDDQSQNHTIAITSYKIKGIFVNNYYSQMKVGSTYPAALVNNGSTVLNYNPTASGTGSYVSTGTGAKLYDWDTAGVGVATGLSYSPDSEFYGTGADELTTPVWAYNVFPTPASTIASVPHIIVMFSEVKWTLDGGSENTLTDYFLTVKGLKKSSVALESIDKGNVYTFADIRFNQNQLTDVPEVQTISALVDVEIMKWKDNAVEADI